MNDLSEFVTLSDTTLTTDSRRVAKHFHKRHDSVLRAYDSLKIEDDYRRRNFAETVEMRSNPSGGADIPSRVVQMTKNGFVLLVMGFTGKEAMRIKIAYIEAFDEMANQLQQISINGFRSLWEERIELEKKDATTFMWASFGSKRMLERKKELPGIRDARERLETEMQPPLFLIADNGAGAAA